MADKKARRPLEERKEIKRIMAEKGVKYTTALRELEKAKKGASCAEYDACVLDGDCPLFENCYLIGPEEK